MLAALLAISSAAAFASAANAESYGTYYIKPAASAVVSAPVVLEQSAVIAPETTVISTPLVEQILIQPAVIMPLPGFSMDPAAMALYTGPRLENTLTMPDANTYLRGY
jgi:hypothetical protein